MKIRFTENNPYGAYPKSEYIIHDTYDKDGRTHYCFDVGDGLPPFVVTQASIKGYAVIESGEASNDSEDIYSKLKEEYGDKEDKNTI